MICFLPRSCGFLSFARPAQPATCPDVISRFSSHASGGSPVLAPARRRGSGAAERAGRSFRPARCHPTAPPLGALRFYTQNDGCLRPSPRYKVGPRRPANLPERERRRSRPGGLPADVSPSSTPSRTLPWRPPRDSRAQLLSRAERRSAPGSLRDSSFSYGMSCRPQLANSNGLQNRCIQISFSIQF